MKKTLILEPGQMHILCIGAHPSVGVLECWRQEFPLLHYSTTPASTYVKGGRHE